MEPALLSSIILSDGVIQEQGTGKLSFIGTFHVFRPNKIPFLAPPFFITVLVTNLPRPPRELNVAVRVEMPRIGHVIFSASASLKFHEEPARFPDHAVFEVPFFCPNISFAEPGTYRISVLVNDEPLGQRFLSIEPAQATDPAHN